MRKHGSLYYFQVSSNYRNKVRKTFSFSVELAEEKSRGKGKENYLKEKAKETKKEDS